MIDQPMVEASSLPVRSYMRSLRDRWRWILTGAVLGLLAGGLYLVVTPPQYTATAVVAIQPIQTDPFGSGRSGSGLVDMATETQFAGSWTTATQAATTLGEGWSASQLMAATEVTAEPQGTVMRVECTLGSEQAIECADAMASAYLELRTQQALALSASLTTAIDTRIEELTKDIAAASAASGSSTTSAEARVATARAELARQEISALVAQRTSLVTLAKNAGDVITPAENSRLSRSPNPAVVLAGGLVFGLFLGLVGALLRDRFSSPMSSGEQLAELVDLPVWLPERGRGADRWTAASELFDYAVQGKGNVAVTAADHPASLALANFLVDSHPDPVSDVKVVPTGSSAEILAGARAADAVVVVLAPRTHRQDVVYLVTLLHAIGSDVLGLVLADTEDMFGQGVATQSGQDSHDSWSQK